MKKPSFLSTTFKLFLSFGLALIYVFCQSAYAQSFNHPGTLNSKADLDFVKDNIQNGAQPWTSAWGALKGSQYAKLINLAAYSFL